MTTIGNFKADDNGYNGTLQTLGFKAKVTIEKIEKAGDNGPDFRVFNAKLEIGAGWVHEAKSGRKYVRVKIDDPSFAAPLYANLLENAGQHDLIWSR